MTGLEFISRLGSKPARFSFGFIIGTLVLAGWLKLGTPLIVALFAYFALTRLHFVKRLNKWVIVAIFLVLIALITWGLGHFFKQTVRTLPEVANKAIPSFIQYAQRYQIELPFTDYDSLKDMALELVTSQTEYLRGAARFARTAGKELVFVAVGIVVAIGLFINPKMEPGRAKAPTDNLYSLCCDQVALRFQTLFGSFATVMGAQLIISAINTVLTGLFAAAVHLPYAVVVIGVTFLCGLVPVVGNLVSNTIIVGIGLTVSPGMAVAALVFLVVIHKLEYFLNSKIIGDRIQFPLWLTLLGLILGERLMGIPGMILAPVVLNYIRLEASAVKLAGLPEAGRGGGANPKSSQEPAPVAKP